MSEIERLQDAFMKADSLAQQGNAQAAQDAKMFAQEIRRIQKEGVSKPSKPVMSEFNRGVANVIDTINPGNLGRKAINAITGSELPTDVSAVKQMPELGVPVSQGDPDGIWAAAQRGAGEAMTAVPLMATGSGLVGAGAQNPIVRNVANDIYRGLTSKLGLATETAAGAVGGGTEKAMRDAGAPEWATQLAAIGAPVAALGGIGAAARAGDAGINKLPLAGTAYRAGKQALGAVAPMTRAGAFENASQRARQLVGGDERAAEIGARITEDNPLNLTPAQQTGDPDLLGLERAAAAEEPELRDALDARAAQSRGRAEDEIAGMGGSPDDARKYFNTRRRQFGESMQERIDRVTQMGSESVEGVEPTKPQSAASEDVVSALKIELEAQTEVERRLWNDVPKEVTITPSESRQAAQRLIDETVWAQADDVPPVIRQFAEMDRPQTVAELHGLYSKLRETARAARAGTNQQRNMARIADEVANAVLDDLGAIDGSTPWGKAINDARAFSAELHQKFDQGTVGKMLNRTIDGDERIDPATALGRTLGRGKEDALVASRDIREAAPQAADDMAQSLRGGFTDAIMSPTGEFNERGARTWLRKNREVLQQQYPELLGEMQQALKNRTQAAAFSARGKSRMKLDNQTPTGRIADGSPEKAVHTVIGATEPSKEARLLVNAARKDKSGKALAGIKGAFSDYLIGKAGTADGLSGEELFGLLSSKKTNEALREIFDGDEFARISKVARELRKLDAPASQVNEVLNSPANQLLETMARIAAAKGATRLAGANSAGVGLQAAQMGSSRAKKFLQNLTNDKARQILKEAVQDPELMRDLLNTRPTSRRAERVLSRFMTGAGAAATVDDQ